MDIIISQSILYVISLFLWYRSSNAQRTFIYQNLPICLFLANSVLIAGALEYLFLSTNWVLICFYAMELATFYYSPRFKTVIDTHYRMILAMFSFLVLINLFHIASVLMIMTIFIATQFFFDTRLSNIIRKYPGTMLKVGLLCGFLIMGISLLPTLAPGMINLLFTAACILMLTTFTYMLAHLFDIPLPLPRYAALYMYFYNDFDYLWDLLVNHKITWYQLNFMLGDQSQSALRMLDNPFVLNALQADTFTMDKLIQLDPEIQRDVSDCESLLHLIALMNLVDVIEHISPESMEIDAVDASNETALIKAIKAGHGDIVNALLRFGANPNFQSDNFSKPPLYYAIKHSHLEIMKALLTHKADPNFIMDNGEYPLHWAARNKDPNFVLWLIGSGAEKNHTGAALTLIPEIYQPAIKMALEYPLLAVSTHDDLALVERIVKISEEEDFMPGPVACFRQDNKVFECPYHPILNARDHYKKDNMRIMLLKSDNIMNLYAHSCGLKPIKAPYTKVVKLALFTQKWDLYRIIAMLGRTLDLPIDVLTHCLSFLYAYDQVGSFDWNQFINDIPNMDQPFKQHKTSPGPRDYLLFKPKTRSNSNMTCPLDPLHRPQV